jgi:hypothetical protein
VRPQSHGSQLLPILVYLAVAAGYAVPYLLGRDGEVIDVTGHLWRTQDLRETVVVMMLFTMLFSSTLALMRWAARRGTVTSKIPIARTSTAGQVRGEPGNG